MSADVVAWLESPEGDEWRESNITPVFASVLNGRAEEYGQVPLAAILADPGIHSRAEAEMGPLSPEHDPCGRPSSATP